MDFKFNNYVLFNPFIFLHIAFGIDFKLFIHYLRYYYIKTYIFSFKKLTTRDPLIFL